MAMKAIVVSLLLTLAAPALAQSPDWQKAWEATLAGAKKEGKVVIAGSPDPVMRNEVIPKFTARYGIPVDFIAGRSGQLVERVKIERPSGIYSVDVYMSGPDTQFNVLYAEQLIDPLKPMLILPEVTDGAKWKRGGLWFMDPQQQYVLRLFNSVDSVLFINTDHVEPEEMRSVYDLLQPKWRGKIVTEDPTSDSGTGGNTAANFYSQLGPDFVKKLYVDQKAVVSRDRRQMTDWLARGTYPICLSCRSDDVRPLQKDGFKILEVYQLAGLQNRINSSPFLLSVANKAPHPNATRVFVNWLAGKEALEIYSRGFDAATLRTDVDESFLDPRAIPRADAPYPDDADPKWRSGEKPEIGKKLRALLKQP
jgi:iron(III) transport system substrate-binding protein